MKLGEAMVKEGLITNDTLAKALERQIIFGGRLGTNLVEMGAVPEETLARFLGKVLGVPYAGPEQFNSVPQDALDAVSREKAEKYTIFPLRKERSRLHLAMKDPNDIAIVDELRFVLGTEIKGYIASEIRILYALEKYYGIKRDLRYVNILDEEQTFTGPHPSVAARPAEIKPPAPPKAEEESFLSAPEPAFEPAPEATANFWAKYEEKNKPSPYEMLASPVDRETIAGAVVMAAGEKLSRVALLRVKDGVLSGWQGQVSGEPADVSKLMINLGNPCIFKEAVEGKSLYKGPVAPLPQNDLLLDALGGDRPVEAVTCPLVIREKVVGVLYGDNGPGSMTRCDTAFFSSLMAKASISLEILILRNKILS